MVQVWFIVHFKLQSVLIIGNSSESLLVRQPEIAWWDPGAWLERSVVALTIRCILSTSRAERLSLRPVRALVSLRGLSWTLVLGWLASSIRRAERLSLELLRVLVPVLDLGLLTSSIRAWPIRLRLILVGCVWLVRRSSWLVVLGIRVNRTTWV
jgi:hypothetical protein